MLQLLGTTHDNIIATRANDLLGIHDYEKIHPLIHNIISNGKKVRWYFEMDDCLISDTAGFWEDGIVEVKYGKMNFTHSEDIEMIAIVGKDKWKEWMYAVMKPFTRAEIKYFDLSEKEAAMEWLKNNNANGTN
ncbi:MAG: STAS/SEC14 domain-containing protein [Chitinophagaceae bacterium]|mgnify:CR=1 FL=1|nr:STAS/SEC14 domain-containing protein [Chitinophagaceae bacterium]